jgi:S-adenosylmethionine:tRNA ribosyltransferase-isomerase
VEVLVERIIDDRRALVQARSSKPLKPGRRIAFAQGVDAEMLGRHGEFFELRFGDDVLEVMERLGEVPLPPYITHTAMSDDEARYQTVYARVPAPSRRRPRDSISMRRSSNRCEPRAPPSRT